MSKQLDIGIDVNIDDIQIYLQVKQECCEQSVKWHSPWYASVLIRPRCCLPARAVFADGTNVYKSHHNSLAFLGFDALKEMSE
jgi:hypothetical protein